MSPWCLFPATTGNGRATVAGFADRACAVQNGFGERIGIWMSVRPTNNTVPIVCQPSHRCEHTAADRPDLGRFAPGCSCKVPRMPRPYFSEGPPRNAGAALRQSAAVGGQAVHSAASGLAALRSACRRRVVAAHQIGLLVAAAFAIVVGVFGGCGSAPSSGRDGPPANPPADLIRTPDAEPRVESIRIGGPNKPYEVLGRRYVPITQDAPFSERGLASWYGRKFQGLPTSSGEPYDLFAMTAAHPTLPIPSFARIRNPANGREVIVRINDRGPFHPGRIVDLSYTAALKLDLLRGVAPVELERLTFDDIRTGAWRRDNNGGDETRLAASRAPAPMSTPTPATRVDATTVAAVVAASGNGRPDGAAPASDRSSVAGSDDAAVVTPSDAAVSATRVAADDRPASITTSPALSPSTSASTPTPASTGAPNSAPALASAAAPAASLIPTPMPTSGAKAPGPGFWVQIGAFRARRGAETFQQRVSTEFDWLKPLLAIFDDAPLYRLQAGPYASRDEALGAAGRVRDDLKLVPIVVEQR